jgi:hypothetical protein
MHQVRSTGSDILTRLLIYTSSQTHKEQTSQMDSLKLKTKQVDEV